MLNQLSKNSFIEKLSFYLSFHFNHDESTGILNDYEEWFNNESSLGKSEEEICAALEKPQIIVRNLLTESPSTSSKLYILFHNTMIQAVLLIVVHYFASFLLAEICSVSSLNYLFLAFGINFIYYLIGSLIKTGTYRVDNRKLNFSLSAFMLVLVLFEILILPHFNSEGGRICVAVLTLASLLLLLINVFVSCRNVLHNGEFTFMTMLHFSGIITILFFVINQLHALYDSMTEYSFLIYGSISLYAEIAVLSLIYYMIKKYISKKA